MRRRMTALALATAALLTAGAGLAGTAHAAVSITADDVVIPAGDQNTADTPAAETEADREVALARGSRQAADLMGFLPSLYQGKWFVPSSEDVRRCIVLRESHANYRATNGTYHGAYQMSTALAVGATWMMQKDVRKEMGDEGRIPPPLTGVGGKLTADWLKRVLSQGSKDRPYMHTRMPKFDLKHAGPMAHAMASLDELADVKLPTFDVPSPSLLRILPNQPSRCASAIATATTIVAEMPFSG